jgi:alpha-tubulin suppressor-like RCC1 family protein
VLGAYKHTKDIMSDGDFGQVIKRAKIDNNENDSLYSFGSSEGGLGRADDENVALPTLISKLPHIRVLKVACGRAHALLLTSTQCWWLTHGVGVCGCAPVLHL